MTANLLTIPFLRADGSSTTLQDFGARAFLIVNVASKCGLTPQYDGLEKLYEQYKDQGLTIIGFPANDFADQEPGSDEEIQQFCRMNFGVKFPIMKKVVVKGEGQHPLFAALTAQMLERQGAGATSFLHKIASFFTPKASQLPVLWNFEKFLVSGDGQGITRFSPEVVPEDPRIKATIEAALAEKV